VRTEVYERVDFGNYRLTLEIINLLTRLNAIALAIAAINPSDW